VESPVVRPEAKRRRVKPEKFSELGELSKREQELFQQAVANSRWEKSLARFPIDPAPTYRPSEEEFLDPLKYIESIRPEAEKFGICKIVPPKSWRNERRPLKDDASMKDKKFGTKKQRIDRLQESVPYEDGGKYTMKEYEEMAEAFRKEWDRTHPSGVVDEYDEELERKLGVQVENTDAKASDDEPRIYFHGDSVEAKEREKLESDYWKLVDESAEEVVVEYGNDVDVDEYSSGFPRGTANGGGAPSTTKGGASSGWNLNNVGKCDGSVLKHFDVKLPGINTPWLYVGMLFSTFSWHNEDNYLASINYHHFGAAKQWYGVPGKAATAFENVVRRFYKQRLLEVPDLLHNMNTMFSPSKLKALNVDVYKVTQEPGEFVLTFPQAFHSGFSFGFNCGEAVNFATYHWIEFAVLASERYRRLGRLAVLGHDRLLFTLANHALRDKNLRAKEADLLYKELDRVIKEDLVLRPRLYGAGVRDVRDVVKPPPNDLRTVDAEAADYDDKRVCSVCRHTCFLSAVACNCSQTDVACLRHVSYLCKCPNVNKYLIEWETNDNLLKLLKDLHDLRKELGGGNDGLTPELDPDMQVAGPFGPTEPEPPFPPGVEGPPPPDFPLITGNPAPPQGINRALETN